MPTRNRQVPTDRHPTSRRAAWRNETHSIIGIGPCEKHHDDEPASTKRRSCLLLPHGGQRRCGHEAWCRVPAKLRRTSFANRLRMPRHVGYALMQHSQITILMSWNRKRPRLTTCPVEYGVGRERKPQTHDSYSALYLPKCTQVPIPEQPRQCVSLIPYRGRMCKHRGWATTCCRRPTIPQRGKHACASHAAASNTTSAVPDNLDTDRASDTSRLKILPRLPRVRLRAGAPLPIGSLPRPSPTSRAMPMTPR